MDPFDEVLARRIGQVVGGRWTLTQLLGAGGMAAVYAAEDASGHRVAVKLLHPEMGIRRDIRERFLREAEVMSRIVHPGMVTIFEQGADADTAYIAMELLEGEVIATRARRDGQFPVDEVLRIVDELLDVLIVAHRQGIIHRDIKPENLFLSHDGRVKVLDFGLARLLDETTGSFRTRTGAALGTLPYMAPEQALGRRDEIDARTDLFAVGATAFRLLSGRRIHEAPSEAELLIRMASVPAPEIKSVLATLPEPIAVVIDRSLAFTRTSRYPDAATMQTDIRAVAQGQLPPYATRQANRENEATRVDLPAATAPTAPVTHRGAGGTVVMPASVRSAPSAPVGPDPFQAPGNGPKPQPFVAEAQIAATLDHVPSRRLAPTASMPAVAEQLAHAPAALAPAAMAPTISAVAAPLPMSPPYALGQSPLAPADGRIVVQRATSRKRTLIVGLGLLAALLATTTALALLWWRAPATGTADSAAPTVRVSRVSTPQDPQAGAATGLERPAIAAGSAIVAGSAGAPSGLTSAGSTGRLPQLERTSTPHASSPSRAANFVGSPPSEPPTHATTELTPPAPAGAVAGIPQAGPSDGARGAGVGDTPPQLLPTPPQAGPNAPAPAAAPVSAKATTAAPSPPPAGKPAKAPPSKGRGNPARTRTVVR